MAAEGAIRQRQYDGGGRQCEPDVDRLTTRLQGHPSFSTEVSSKNISPHENWIKGLRRCKNTLAMPAKNLRKCLLPEVFRRWSRRFRGNADAARSSVWCCAVPPSSTARERRPGDPLTSWWKAAGSRYSKGSVRPGFRSSPPVDRPPATSRSIAPANS